MTVSFFIIKKKEIRKIIISSKSIELKRFMDQTPAAPLVY
jgi:hypothetical protein